MSAQVVGSRETSELARTNVKMEQLETDRAARMDGRTNERLAWRGGWGSGDRARRVTTAVGTGSGASSIRLSCRCDWQCLEKSSK